MRRRRQRRLLDRVLLLGLVVSMSMSWSLLGSSVPAWLLQSSTVLTLVLAIVWALRA